MNAKWFVAFFAATAMAVSVGVLVSTSASAAPDTLYCVNGVSTTLPVDLSASSETAGDMTGSFTEENAAYVLENSPEGLFYLGYNPDDEEWYVLAGGIEDPNTFFEPGFTTNYVGLGSCTKGPPPVTYVGVCKMLERGDGTMGMFQQVTVAEWNDKEGRYYDAVPANWVEGVGLTCDNPVALGYKPAGYNVAWGGKQDANHDVNGVRASGFNNIYPYFTK